MNRVIRQALACTILGADRIEAMFGGAPGALVERPGEVRVVMVWTMDRIGDVQRMTPLLRLLRQRWATARLSVVVAGRSAPVLMNNPHIDKLHVINSPYSLGEHLQLLRHLHRSRCDLGILAEVDPFWAKLGAWWFRLLGAGYGAGFDLGVMLPPRFRRVPLRKGGSWIDQFVRLADAVDAGGANGGTEFFLNDREKLWARDFLGANGIGDGAPFFLIHPGSSFKTVSRQWPAEHYSELIALLRRFWSYPIVVTGTGEERETVAPITARADPPVVDLCGAVSLRQLAAIIDRATLCIMNDTGPLHIAHALGRKTVVILGPTAPEVIGLPATARSVHAELSCRPCAYLEGWRACSNPIEWECLKRVAPDAVLGAVKAQLGDSVLKVQQ